MDNPSSADLNMIEELLARMQQNPGQLYDDVDDEDDDDYDDDDDDDDDDDGYYGEHNIHTLLNTYGGGGGGGCGEGEEMGENGGNMQLPNAQTMNFLQGLLGMNNSNIPAMADIEAAIGGSMGGLGGMSNPMEGGSGGFHTAMQSLIPNMGTDMAGMLAGAFAGGMMSDYGGGHGGGATVHEAYDDDEDDDDDDDEDDDDDALSDEEDEEDEDDDDDDDEEDKMHHRRIDASDVALGAVGGLMAAGLLANHGSANHHRGYPDPYHQHPAQMPPPPTSSSQTHNIGMAGVVAPIGFSVPSTTTSPLCRSPQPSCPPTSTMLSTQTTSSLGRMSGGTVCKTDPLSALVAGMGGLAIGAGIVSPIVSNLLGSSSGGSTVVHKHNDSNSVIGNNDTYNNSNRTHPGHDVGPSSFMLSQLTSAHKQPMNYPKLPQSNPSLTMIKAQLSHESQLQATIEKDKSLKTKEECEDDKASLGSVTGSETSGMGKSDTESVGKKTPSPLPESSESPNSQEVGSCASIPDLASTTESMRDSDTDNHSEVHNVTANLSDLDNDTPHDQQKSVPVNPYAVGPLPIVVERPTYGWGSMVGLETAKQALKSLFVATSFPEVFEGTEGTCRGVLLFGPSGSGKTCLSRALAKESSNSLFVGISSRYLLSCNPMDAIKIVRCMFEQARCQRPAIILFDEIEALSYHPSNESAMRAKDEILAQVRGLSTVLPAYTRQEAQSNNESIMVLATTNQPWLLEDRIRRVFAYNIHVKLPVEKARHEIFRMFLQNLHNNINDEQYTCLVSKSEGYSAADINAVVREASHRVPLEANCESRPLSFDDLATIMTQYRCRFTDELKKKYSSYITAATHRAEDVEDNSKIKKDKKGVKKFSHKIAKSLAVAVLSVID